MPKDETLLNPPIQFSMIWLIIGLILIVCLVLWFGGVLWYTKVRKPKTIDSLARLSDDFDMTALKARYLQLVDECYSEYRGTRTTLKGLHRGLSMTVRYFVYEASLIPAPRLTLADIKKASLPQLSQVIEDYYSKEFAALEHGSAEESVRLAKDFINRWV